MDTYDSVMQGILDAFRVGAMAAIFVLAFILGGALLYLIHYCLTLPMRRAERARLFLDMVANTIKQGRPLEETLVSLAYSRDDSMGLRFHLLAAWIETGLRFDEALARVPGFLPPQVVAMLGAGRQIGDLAKVLPASRRLLDDAVSQTRGAINYLVVLTFVITPGASFILALISIFVAPKFLEMGAGMGLGSSATLLALLAGHAKAIVLVQTAVLLAVWMVAFLYIGGPRVTAWFPMLERVHYRLPWRRRRMQRDFSTLLALLLDAGMPEPAALTVAAAGTANSVFRRRAALAVEGLRQGLTLPEAVRQLDDAGEFQWRLRNAAAAPGGFLRALNGWHESLDARAFQEEQAAAHGITTALVLWTGLFVGTMAVSVFLFLVATIDTGVLW